MMTDTPQAIEFRHGDRTWHVPSDLLDVQKRWDEADRECSRLAGELDTTAYNEARGRRLDLTLELYRHPWLVAAQQAQCRYQADLALKACARQ